MKNMKDIVIFFFIISNILYSKGNCDSFVHKIYVNKDDDILILFDNQRFIFETSLFYNDDSFKGSWEIVNENLIMISDKIQCNLPEKMNIVSANLIKFQFEYQFNTIKFINLEYYNDSLKNFEKSNIDINENTTFTQIGLDTIIKRKKFSHYLHYLNFNDFFKCKNCVNPSQNIWLSENKSMVLYFFGSTMPILIDLCNNEIRYGYINNYKTDLHNKNLTVLEIIWDNIIYHNYGGFVTIIDVSFDKMFFCVYEEELIMENHFQVKGKIGNESNYSMFKRYPILKKNVNQIKFFKIK